MKRILVVLSMVFAIALSSFGSKSEAKSSLDLPYCEGGWYYSDNTEDCGHPCCVREIYYHCESSGVVITCTGLSCQNPDKFHCYQTGG